ncbi:GNAT family N-acetyltransferase [Streptococcus constellatus]|uniref:GNAT family N-acetyltransferase n=1 Tax=Streptococcus constellatus TaxID=76860 RepID=UPI0028E2F1BD|nr:GNAT family N-acetyltransferase [Streptococcus constellatus]
MNIRLANKNDAAALVAIYAPYVEKTAITFEYDVPSVEEFSGRIEKTLKNILI